MASSRPPLLLVGSGSENRHRRILQDMSRRAFLVLLQPGPVTWQLPIVDEHAEFDPANSDDIVDLALSLARKHGADSVVTYDETMLPYVGAITQAGLRGLSHEAAITAKDKHAQRRLLRPGERPVRSQLVYDAASARIAADDLGYPVVMKPRSLSGHLGARIVATADDTFQMFHEAGASTIRGFRPTRGVLVEEFLGGPEFTIDCWALDGRATALFTARALMGLAPHTIDIGFIVGPGVAPPEAVRAMQDAACAAALTCGVDRTIANVDVKWTKGEPRILEVNGRPGGMLPLLALQTSGLRVGEVLADVALGRIPEPQQSLGHAAGLAFIFPQQAGRFGGLEIPSSLASVPWIERVQELVLTGSKMLPPDQDPWGYVGWVLVTGEHAEIVEDRITQVRAQVSVRSAP